MNEVVKIIVDYTTAGQEKHQRASTCESVKPLAEQISTLFGVAELLVTVKAGFMGDAISASSLFNMATISDIRGRSAGFS